MIQTVLFYTHYTLILLFGILLSAVFSGVQITWKNTGILSGLFAISGIMQIVLFISFGEATVWKLYPVITHLPIVFLLCLYYHKRISTALAAITTAYLCCQPAKWFGLLISSLSGSNTAEQLTRILTLIAFATISILFLASYISEIYNKDTRSILIFSIVPMVYYLFDYSMSIYTDFWTSNNRTTVEFMPFLLCIVHVAFCVIYFKEYERKTDAERREQIFSIALNQQAKEIQAVKQSEQEIRMLRHDMRLFLNNIALCIEDGNTKMAREIISGFTQNVHATVIKRYCDNATINYIISDCAAKCLSANIAFNAVIELSDLPVDEIMYASILSNALDNAINAQMEMSESERSIRLMLKTIDNRLLLSVKNPFKNKPIFADGLPISHKKGHGYGSQSIRYMTECLGGSCQFSTEADTFILRVLIEINP